MTTTINIGRPMDEYYLCDCPKCLQGAHHNPLRVKEYRERGKRIAELEAEVERLSKLTEDCLNVIRVYCPTYYNDEMERFNASH